MTGLNITRVTLDQTNNADDPFSFAPCIELQNKGQQIVQTRCGHLMEEQALITWALQIINRPLGQERVISCPLCREDLTNANFPTTFYAQIIRTPAIQAQLNRRAGPPPVRDGEQFADLVNRINRRNLFNQIVFASVLLAAYAMLITDIGQFQITFFDLFRLS